MRRERTGGTALSFAIPEEPMSYGPQYYAHHPQPEEQRPVFVPDYEYYYQGPRENPWLWDLGYDFRGQHGPAYN